MESKINRFKNECTHICSLAKAKLKSVHLHFSGVNPEKVNHYVSFIEWFVETLCLGLLTYIALLPVHVPIKYAFSLGVMWYLLYRIVQILRGKEYTDGNIK